MIHEYFQICDNLFYTYISVVKNARLIEEKKRRNEMKQVMQHLVKGFEVKENERVLLHVFGSESDIVEALRKEIEKQNGQVSVVYRDREKISENYKAGYIADFSVYETCDTVIDILFYGIRPAVDFPEDKMNDYREEMMTIMKMLMSKEKFIQLRIPTEENAMMVGMPLEQYESLALEAMTVDYDALKKETQACVEAMSDYKTVEIKTDEHKLCFSIEGCQWHKDDGLGDMPAGEVYVAPIVTSANGTIKIPKLNLEGEVFENFTLTFKEGLLTTCSEANLMDYIQSAPGDSSMFAEFGIGLNPNIKQLTGYPLFDEKMKGTYHVAVGMNTAFGGTNDTPLHLDFVFKGDVSFR